MVSTLVSVECPPPPALPIIAGLKAPRDVLPALRRTPHVGVV